ncbi:uncharacterized protein LOC119189619 [Manduca sexta]|uniref:uncharacterized protein LOC119189618 n=1 Tax=Manduca sexta TaxID=7130 RepID=UPI00188E03E5|nr:uncharacterized protein LOC119189618 [Manduca sexta]XP_037295707.1 uncharacterized protein LOC119189618 [Manduca sexta]XP_037295708.1 uncharacterized protein LOC119189619 [Manduca sexta]XP_037295709.1 uncharacterized protein LOC119189619 [Manduca sexta]
MRIQKFNTLLAKESKPHVLKNCSLVIDAQNYFYEMYKKSELSANYGCESNHFANFLKNELGKFIKANVKCYFIFKGGSKDIEKRRNKKMTQYYGNFVSTVFMKTICRQVLEEMGFDYVICELEAKEQCVALANKLKYPTMSNDIEVGILSNSYINYYQVSFNPTTNGIQCKLLRFSNFLRKYKLTIEKFSVFILVTDTTIYPEGFFADFLKRFEVRNQLAAQYEIILRWLSSQSKDEALNEVTKTFKPKERNDILLKEKDILNALRTPPSLGIPYHYFFNKQQIHITPNDLQWFEKGIALRYIAIPYINLYTQGIIDGGWAFHDRSMPDALLFSADIIKYALNLLSNYSRDSFQIERDNGESIKVSTKMPDVPKPDYTVSNVIFEDGWDRVEKLRLLNIFIGTLSEVPNGNSCKHCRVRQDC